MDSHLFFMPFIGGLCIGLAGVMYLLFCGRVFGISGIFAGILLPKQKDTSWRIAALLGLLAAGALLLFLRPSSFPQEAENYSIFRYILAGLLVGFGSQMGNGCTSGHSVCGISRCSPRSILATCIFIFAGIVAVALMKKMGIAL